MNGKNNNQSFFAVDGSKEEIVELMAEKAKNYEFDNGKQLVYKVMSIKEIIHKMAIEKEAIKLDIKDKTNFIRKGSKLIFIEIDLNEKLGKQVLQEANINISKIVSVKNYSDDDFIENYHDQYPQHTKPMFDFKESEFYIENDDENEQNSEFENAFYNDNNVNDDFYSDNDKFDDIVKDFAKNFDDDNGLKTVSEIENIENIIYMNELVSKFYVQQQISTKNGVLPFLDSEKDAESFNEIIQSSKPVVFQARGTFLSDIIKKPYQTVALGNIMQQAGSGKELVANQLMEPNIVVEFFRFNLNYNGEVEFDPEGEYIICLKDMIAWMIENRIPGTIYFIDVDTDKLREDMNMIQEDSFTDLDNKEDDKIITRIKSISASSINYDGFSGINHLVVKDNIAKIFKNFSNFYKWDSNLKFFNGYTSPTYKEKTMMPSSFDDDNTEQILKDLVRKLSEEN